MRGSVIRLQACRRLATARKNILRAWAWLAFSLLLSSASAAWAVKTLSVSPGSLEFGDQMVGTQSASQTVTLTNTGDQTVTVAPPSLQGGNGVLDFPGTQNCTSPPLAPGESCQIRMTFSPTAAGPRSTTLVIPSDADGSPFMVALSGNGTPPPAPAIDVSPPSLTFASQAIGTASAAQLLTVTNTGTASLVISSVSVAPGGEFAATGGGGTLAPGSSQSVGVTFSPTGLGTRSATLSIASNAPGGTVLVPLSGTGAPPPAPAVALSAASLSFGSQKVGTTSAAQSVTLTNTGDAPLHVTSTTLTGANKADFGLAGGGALTLASGESQTISVDFAPGVPGNRVAAISIADDAAGSPQTVSLSGTGTVPVVALGPASLGFGSQVIDTTSPAMSFTVTNTGLASLTITSVALTGANAGDFAITGGSGPVSLAPGDSQTVTVTFTPAATGPRTAAVTIVDDAGGSPHSVSLTGSGAPVPAPAISVSPTSLSFADQAVGTISGPKSITVTNTGTAPLVIGGVSVTPGGEFAAVGGGGTLPPGSSQSISVTFSPTGQGIRSATLSIASNTTSGTSTVALTGTGAPPPAPAVTLSAASLSFGSQVINTTSASMSFTLTNTGLASLTITSVTITGANAADFAIAGGSSPGSLAPGDGRAVSVTFTPSASGPRTAAVTIADDAGGSPHSVTLTGSGAPPPAPDISVSPPSLAFASQTVGTTSGAKSVTITNTGTAPLVISDVSVTPGGEFGLSGGGGSVAPNDSQTISVTFTPAAVGPRSATLSISSNAAGGMTTVSLSGIGAPPPAPGVSLSPAALEFGSQVINTTSAARSFTITNTGTAPLNVTGIALGGADPGDFASIAGGDPVTLAPGTSRTVTLTFTPSALGSRSAVVSVTDDVPGSPHTVSLTGAGTSPLVSALSISPGSLDFGNQRVGVRTAAMSFRLTNVGNTLLHFTGITLQGANAVDFAFTAGSGITTLAAGASQDIGLTFTPSVSGNRAAVVSIASDAPGSPQIVVLTGVGIAPAVTISPASLDFGGQRVSTTSGELTATLTNTGDAPLVVTGMSLTGTNKSNFAFTSGNGPITLGPGASQTFGLTFTPNAAGSRKATVTIADDAAGSPHTIGLSGTGTVPGVTLAPAHLDFGNQEVNTTSAAQSFTITNTGDAPLTISSITLTGTQKADFALAAGDTPVTLAPNDSQTVSVTFTPSTAGNRSASVSVADDASGSPQKVTLTGTGTVVPVPALSISPASLSFSALTVGSASAAKSFKLTNSGTAALEISSITLQGADPGDFAFAAGNGVTLLAPGASQTISLTFTPTATGSRSAAVSIVDNAAGSPHTVTLSGTGNPVLAPGVALSPGSLDFGDQLVSSTSAKLNVTLTNTGNTTLHVAGASLGGPEAGDFAITAGGTAGTVAAGSSRTIRVEFTPSSAGRRGGTLSITDDAPGSPHTVSLVGNGVQPGIAVSPASLEFGSQPVRERSAAKNLTVTNTGAAPLTISRVSISPSGEFTASGGTGTLAPGESRSIGVTFSPAAVGDRSATLSISSNAAGSASVVALHGIGLDTSPPLPGKPALAITPASVSFAGQSVGSTSGAQTVVIISIGTAPVNIRSITLSGAHARDFKVTAGGEPGTIAEGTRRTVSISFAPTAAGTRSATLVVSSNVTGSPHTVPLTGAGVAIPAAPVAPLVAGDWPQAAHDPRHLGLADGATDPRGLVPWSLPLGAISHSVPVARGGVIYAGTDSGVVAVDAATRKVRWTRALPSPARSALAVTEKAVVVSADGLWGLRPADGSVLWQRVDLGANEDVAPLLVGDTVYIGLEASGRAAAMVAVDAATGADIWTALLPAGFDGRVAAAAYPELGLLFVALAPVASPNRASAGPSAVLALRLADGGTGWSAPIFPASPPADLSVGWVDHTPAQSLPQPAVFLAAGQSVTALNVWTGAALWSRLLPEQALVGPPVISTAAPQGATLFVGGAGGQIYPLSSTTGADAGGGPLATTAPIVGPLALAGSTLIAPTSDGLIALDTTTGAPVWNSPLVAASGVSFANGTPLVVTADGRLVGFSR